MTGLKRIQANTVKRLQNDRGLPNFNINFYIVNKRGDYAGRDALMARLEALDDLKPAPRSDELDEIDGVFVARPSKVAPPGD